MTGDHTILSVAHLTVSFPGAELFTAVNDVSFQLGSGKTLAIVGESGSGKSLTALSLIGLLPANSMASGSILLKGKETLIGDFQGVRGKEIGIIFQEPMTSLNPLMKVGKQLREAISAQQPISAKEATQQAINWLEKVQLPDPEKIFHRYPHQLSGGQRQRVMIAMAMCNHPAVLIADEPTTALDVTVQREIVQLMQYLQQEHGTALIFITHDLALAAAIADDIMVMEKGNMVEYGTGEGIMDQPQQPYTQALLASRSMPQVEGKPLPVDASALMSVKHLTVSYAERNKFLSGSVGGEPVVNDVSFELYKGEVLGLVGESGSGKSTIAKAIVGLVPALAGEVNFGGTDLVSLDMSGWRQMRRHVQIIFQDPYSSLNPRMTIGNALMEPLAIHGTVSRSGLRNEARRLLELVQLPAASLDKYPHQFSGGQRQRIGIARALSVRPQLLICDEIVSSLDVSIQAQVLNLLRELQAELGLSLLFISHDLSVVRSLGDRVIVLHNGSIVEVGTAEQVLSRPQHPYTQKLVAAAY